MPAAASLLGELDAHLQHLVQGHSRYTRHCLYRGDTALATYDREWAQSMSTQLDAFAADIRANAWHSDNYWDQLPAMWLIEQAYQLAARY